MIRTEKKIRHTETTIYRGSTVFYLSTAAAVPSERAELNESTHNTMCIGLVCNVYDIILYTLYRVYHKSRGLKNFQKNFM